MYILDNERMRAADAHAIETLGIPSLQLMENAGAAVADVVLELMHEAAEGSVLVLCGRGNNGGDGFVVARLLHEARCPVSVVLLAEGASLSPDCATNRELAQEAGVVVIDCDASGWAEFREDLEASAVIVDALLGTGFRGRLTGLLAEVAEDVNAASVVVVAVDVPSGLSGDSSTLEGPAIRAQLTVTFAAPKVCHVFAPACEHCGELIVADIGIPRESIASTQPLLLLSEDEDIARLVEPLAHRRLDTHKGTWGHVVVVGGSIGTTGAPALSALGALTAGCGLVTVATPASCVASVAAHAPELMQVALPEAPSGELATCCAGVVPALLGRASVVVAGPGLGASDGAAALLTALLEQARIPLVLDADALTWLSLTGMPARRADRPLVLTPHPGEFERLCPGTQRLTQLQRVPAALDFARTHGVVLVLKGFRTLVVGPDSEDLVLACATGGPGMATAGAGDVLAGLMAGLIAQGLAPLEAARAAVHLHGRAGDRAELETGQMALRATDILRHFASAVRSVVEPEDDDSDARSSWLLGSAGRDHD